MQSSLKLLAWVVIICLVAALMYFGIQIVTQKPLPNVVPTTRFEPAPAPPVSSASVQKGPTTSESIEPVKPISQAFIQPTNKVEPVKSSEELAKQAEREKRQKIIDESRQQLTALLEKKGGPTVEEVDQVLAKMTGLADAKGVVSGVDLGALRETLKLSGEIQVIAEQIQKESELGEKADPAFLKEKTEALQVLQQKLLDASSNKKIVPGS